MRRPAASGFGRAGRCWCLHARPDMRPIISQTLGGPFCQRGKLRTAIGARSSARPLGAVNGGWRGRPRSGRCTLAHSAPWPWLVTGSCRCAIGVGQRHAHAAPTAAWQYRVGVVGRAAGGRRLRHFLRVGRVSPPWRWRALFAPRRGLAALPPARASRAITDDHGGGLANWVAHPPTLPVQHPEHRHRAGARGTGARRRRAYWRTWRSCSAALADDRRESVSLDEGNRSGAALSGDRAGPLR